MLVYRTVEEKVFREFDSIIMQNMCHNLLLFCTQTWPSHHVIGMFLFRARAEKGIARHIDASSVVWTVTDNGKLANQIARLAAIESLSTRRFCQHRRRPEVILQRN